MEEIIQYLEMKNQYYEKFFKLSTKFLAEISDNRWDDLEYYVDNRERILSIIRSFDFQISKAMETKKISEKETEDYKSNIKILLDRRSEIAAKIVALDLELISRIDEHKTDTIKELKKTVETKQQVDAFSKAPTTQKSTKSA